MLLLILILLLYIIIWLKGPFFLIQEKIPIILFLGEFKKSFW